MNTAEYILKKYNIKTDVIEIPNVGRDDLAKLLHELDFKVGVEVGVASGGYSKQLAKYNPQMQVYGVDPYQAYNGYRDYKLERTFARLKSEAEAKLNKYPNYTFVRKFSADAVKDFNQIDFVYIDGNHREPYVTEDITLWAEKVRPGGIVAGHDYARVKGRPHSPDNWAVMDAIHRYTQERGIQLYIWGLEAKIGLKRDRIRSWSFIK